MCSQRSPCRKFKESSFNQDDNNIIYGTFEKSQLINIKSPPDMQTNKRLNYDTNNAKSQLDTHTNKRLNNDSIYQSKCERTFLYATPIRSQGEKKDKNIDIFDDQEILYSSKPKSFSVDRKTTLCDNNPTFFINDNTPNKKDQNKKSKLPVSRHKSSIKSKAYPNSISQSKNKIEINQKSQNDDLIRRKRAQASESSDPSSDSNNLNTSIKLKGSSPEDDSSPEFIINRMKRTFEKLSHLLEIQLDPK